MGGEGGGSISRTASDSKARVSLLQGFERLPSFERVTSKESEREMPPVPHPQRPRRWSITELMAVAGPNQIRGPTLGMVPEGGVAPAGGQQPDMYANQQQQHLGAVNVSGQNWMGDSAILFPPHFPLISPLLVMTASQADTRPCIVPLPRMDP